MRGAERVQSRIYLQADDLNVTFTICAFEAVHRDAMFTKLGMDGPERVWRYRLFSANFVK